MFNYKHYGGESCGGRPKIRLLRVKSESIVITGKMCAMETITAVSGIRMWRGCCVMTLVLLTLHFT